MAQITPQQAGGVNVVAFLDMLAWSEGTDNDKQPTKDRGYDVIVGGQLFKSYADHPRVLVDLPKLKIQSTAAGRYQLLRRCHRGACECLRSVLEERVRVDAGADEASGGRGRCRLQKGGDARCIVITCRVVENIVILPIIQS